MSAGDIAMAAAAAIFVFNKSLFFWQRAKLKTGRRTYDKESHQQSRIEKHESIDKIK